MLISVDLVPVTLEERSIVLISVDLVPVTLEERSMVLISVDLVPVTLEERSMVLISVDLVSLVVDLVVGGKVVVTPFAFIRLIAFFLLVLLQSLTLLYTPTIEPLS